MVIFLIVWLFAKVCGYMGQISWFYIVSVFSVYWKEVFSGLVGLQVWHLIRGCHLCVGSTATNDKC